MTTTIYLIRHGEVHNPRGIIYGRLRGYKLSENGIKEAQQTAEFLKDKKIDIIYSSTLMRAQQTAEIIRERLNLQTREKSKSILELKTSFQGKKFAKLNPDQSDLYLSPKRLSTDETIEDMAVRMHKFIERLSKIHPGKRFVAVSHGDPIMALRAFIRNMPLELPSIRSNKTFDYIKHGEVLELQIEKDGTITEKSVFIPRNVA